MAETYKIGEAAALLNLKTYVLRFWETEFPEISPLRTDKGQRLYTPEHLALLERIRYLLHERGLTIGGARKILAEERARGLAYEFGAQGAVKGLDPDDFAAASDGASAAGFELASGGPQPLRAALHEHDAAGMGDDEFLVAEADDDTGDDTGDEADDYTGELGAHLAQPAHDGPRQCNLPGLDNLLAFRSSLLEEKQGLDSDALEGYGGKEEAHQPEPDAQKGMLPLFAVARAAFLAGKASASGPLTTRGGSNFIQAGSAALGNESSQPAQAEDFGDIAMELEAIAALLRAPLGPVFSPISGNQEKGGLA